MAHLRIRLCQCPSRLALSSRGAAPRAAARAVITTSTPGNSCWRNRKLSRITLRKRFRATADPSARTLTDIPSRGNPRPLARNATPKKLSPARRPFVYRSSNAALARILWRGLNGRRRFVAASAGRGLRNQALAALGSAPCEHAAATLARHACAKAMRAFSVDLARLIRALHDELWPELFAFTNKSISS